MNKEYYKRIYINIFLSVGLFSICRDEINNLKEKYHYYYSCYSFNDNLIESGWDFKRFAQEAKHFNYQEVVIKP